MIWHLVETWLVQEVSYLRPKSNRVWRRRFVEEIGNKLSLHQMHVLLAVVRGPDKQ